MKQFLFLFAAMMLVGITSCSDDACDHKIDKTPSSENLIMGQWYDESENEEMSYDVSGTFYDRYSNVVLSGENEGTYEFNKANMTLTNWVVFLGQNTTFDWKVKDLTEFSFTITSSTSSHSLEKIVEKYSLEVGEKKKLTFPEERLDIEVISYSSKNEGIANVSSDGTVTAMGEKGSTYIKMQTSVGNIWAKITVGEDNKDLWCDYVSLIGANYNTMTKFFSRLGNPLSDGIDYFCYPLSVHFYIKNVNILIDGEKDFIKAIQLFINEGVTPIEIKSYLKSRYYEHPDVTFFSTSPEIEDSRAIVSFDEENRCVLYNDIQSILHPELWYDYTTQFGKDKTAVKNNMEKKGYSYFFTDNTYSKDGSDYYTVEDNDFVQIAAFVFNPDKLASEIWLYMNPKSDANKVYNYLNHKYQENESESGSYSLVFYNKDKTLKVVFDLVNAVVIYTDLTMKQHEANSEILRNYYEGLGMTHDQIITNYGEPLSDDGSFMMYVVASSFVNFAAFTLDETTNLCNYVSVILNESVSEQTVLDNLNSKYTVFQSKNPSEKRMYAWINGNALEESTVGIIYYPDDRMVLYQSLGTNTRANVMSWDIEDAAVDNVIESVSTKRSQLLDAARIKMNSLKKKK